VVGFHTTICGRPAFRLIFTLPFSEPISWIVNIAGDRRSGRRSYYNGEAKLHRTAQFSLAIPAAELQDSPPAPVQVTESPFHVVR